MTTLRHCGIPGHFFGFSDDQSGLCDCKRQASVTVNTRWPLARQCEIPWRFSDISMIFGKIPEISLTAVKFPDISRFSRQVVTLSIAKHSCTFGGVYFLFVSNMRGENIYSCLDETFTTYTYDSAIVHDVKILCQNCERQRNKASAAFKCRHLLNV